jgi:hypothetical protein
MSLVVYFILFCLLTPALSLVGMLGFSYFPNEKIALAIVLISLLVNKKQVYSSSLIVLGLTISLLISTIVIVRWYQGGDVSVPDFNMIYLFCALIFYLTYFRMRFVQIMAVLPVLVCFQLTVSIVQQILLQLEMQNLASIFNNYPPQIGYQIPRTNMGWFRTTGLFNESSQYATFLAIFVISYMEGFYSKFRFQNFVFVLTGIEILLNQSITAYLIIFVYFAYKLLRGQHKMLIILATGAVVLIFFDVFFQEIYEKIQISILAQDESYPRLLFAYRNIEQTINEHIFIGNGLSWDAPSWDVLSIFFSGYGLIGLVGILCFLAYVIKGANIGIKTALIIFLFTNGNLLGSLTIFLVALVYASATHQRIFVNDRWTQKIGNG